MASFGKKELSPNRHDWNPTPLPEQVVLVTTIDNQQQPHVATKSRVSIVAYGPPTLVILACRAEYSTAANIVKNRDFVINIPGDDLVATSWVIGSEPNSRGPSVFEENDITPIPSLKVKSPRLAECRAHLECELEDSVQLGEELMVFGRVVALSVNNDIVGENQEVSYQQLAPFFFLNSNWTASLGAARRVDQPRPGPNHNGTVLTVSDLGKSVDFYSRAFDWPITAESDDRVDFDLPHGRTFSLQTMSATQQELGTTPMSPPEGEVSPVHLHFQCDDLPRALAKLVSVGAAELTDLRESDSGEKSAYFTDPDGNVLIISHCQNLEP